MKDWKHWKSVSNFNLSESEVPQCSKSKSLSDINNEIYYLQMKHFPVKFIDICIESHFKYSIIYDKYNKPYLIDKTTRELYQKPESVFVNNID
jgi:hypothetical protein